MFWYLYDQMRWLFVQHKIPTFPRKSEIEGVKKPSTNSYRVVGPPHFQTVDKRIRISQIEVSISTLSKILTITGCTIFFYKVGVRTFKLQRLLSFTLPFKRVYLKKGLRQDIIKGGCSKNKVLLLLTVLRWATLIFTDAHFPSYSFVGVRWLFRNKRETMNLILFHVKFYTRATVFTRTVSFQL